MQSILRNKKIKKKFNEHGYSLQMLRGGIIEDEPRKNKATHAGIKFNFFRFERFHLCLDKCSLIFFLSLIFYRSSSLYYYCITGLSFLILFLKLLILAFLIPPSSSIRTVIGVEKKPEAVTGCLNIQFGRPA